MRRAVLAVAVVALVAAGCSGDDDGPAVAPTTASDTPALTTLPPAAVRGPQCTLGPPRPEGEVTFVGEGRRLLGVDPATGDARCLADGLGARHPGVQWGPVGDRLLIGSRRAVIGPGQADTGFGPDDRVDWSRPTGKSLLAVTPAGRLLKRPAGGGELVDVSFLDRHESALYHPAGRAVVSVGDGPAGYSVYLADNQGQGTVTLAGNESAAHLGPMAWTASGALLFAAEHEDRWELHRLELGDSELTTIARTARRAEAIADLVASPFPGGGVAWRQGDCSAGPMSLRVSREGRFLEVPQAVAAATPRGWLPGGTLVLADYGEGCGEPRGEAGVYALRDGEVARLASGASEVDVRVPLPAGPELPASIPDQAPA